MVIVWLICHVVSSPTALSARGNHVPSMKPSVELAQRDAAVQLSCTAADAADDLQPISLFDMLIALQVCATSVAAVMFCAPYLLSQSVQESYNNDICIAP